MFAAQVAEGFDNEAQKAVALKQALSRYPLHMPSGFLRHRTLPQTQFCAEIYQAFETASTEIQYVEPMVRTDHRDHPALKRYMQCALNDPWLENQYEGPGSTSHNFRLYRFELDGDLQNGLEEYLYEEESSSISYEPSIGPTTQYVRVDERCLKQSLLPVEPEGRKWGSEARPLRNNTQLDGINAIVVYQGTYFIYSFVYRFTGLKLYSYDAGNKDFANRLPCRWQHFNEASQPKPKEGIKP